MELEHNVISFEDFCVKYKEEMNDTQKYNIAYGSKLELPIQKDLILFVATELKVCDELSAVIDKTLEGKREEKIVAIAQKKADIRVLEDVIEAQPFKSEQAYEYLATAKTIVTDSILPFWFVKRKEQTVIYLCSKNTLVKDRRVDRARFSTAMLKSSKLVVKDQEELAKLQDLYGIEDVYFKPILETNSLEEVKNIILSRKTTAKECVYKKKKETVGIYVKWDESKFILPCIEFLTAQIDNERFDVSLILCRSVKDEYSKSQIENLKQKVRVLQREGLYCGTLQEYQKMQYLVRNMQKFEDVCKEYTDLDAQFLERERKRIWGDLTFDYIIGFGYIKTIWLSLLDMQNTKGKYYIETRQKENLFIPTVDNSPTAHAYFNQNKLYSMIFDKILFTSENMLQFGIERMKLDKNKVGSFSFTANIYGDALEIPELKVAKYREQDYYVVEEYLLNPNKAYVYLVPIPEKNSYIADARNQDAEDLIEGFAKQYDNGETLYIYGIGLKILEALASTHGLENRLFSLGNNRLEFEKMGQFFQGLQGYITSNKGEKANIIRTLTEHLGLPSFDVSKGRKQELEKEFADIAQYRQFVKQELDDLFL